MYDINSAESILEFAKKLENKTLRTACSSRVDFNKIAGKGKYGQAIEKHYFGYELNSKPEPDFENVGIELKVSPLKQLKNSNYQSKERIVLNIINYMEVPTEEFEDSSFWKKNKHLLLIFYLYDKDKNFPDYEVKLVGNWRYSEADLRVIRSDWEIITAKIKAGKAHELSEGDTFYLGACTKGSTAAASLRDQPFSADRAKQRVYSLKQGYVNHIIAKIAGDYRSSTYGKILEDYESQSSKVSIDALVINRFKNHYGKTAEKICSELNLGLRQGSKNYWASITKGVLGVELDKKIEEFEKADIQVKTVRLNQNGMPNQHISFPKFDYEELIKTEWDNSIFQQLLSNKFFFVFYRLDESKKTSVLEKVLFWNMPIPDILEVKQVWDKTMYCVKNGNIVKNITKNGKRETYFPKIKDNRISHVRPHARNSNDSCLLPVPDKLTGVTEYTKHCFWLNAAYIRNQILKS